MQTQDNSSQQDPVTTVKKTEEEGKKQLEKLTTQFNIEFEEKKEILEKKLEEFENTLKERGTKKLETVKQEAGELYKSKLATAESEKNKVISEAQAKEKGGAQLIEKIFVEHIKG